MQLPVFSEIYSPVLGEAGQVRLFEVFDEAFEASASAGGERHLWTIVVHPGDQSYSVVSGHQLVNVASYVVTERPWETGEESFVWSYGPVERN